MRVSFLLELASWVWGGLVVRGSTGERITRSLVNLKLHGAQGLDHQPAGLNAHTGQEGFQVGEEKQRCRQAGGCAGGLCALEIRALSHGGQEL